MTISPAAKLGFRILSSLGVAIEFNRLFDRDTIPKQYFNASF
jgi:hypothetical protein